MNWTMPQMLAVSKQDPLPKRQMGPLWFSYREKKKPAKGKAGEGAGYKYTSFCPSAPNSISITHPLTQPWNPAPWSSCFFRDPPPPSRGMPHPSARRQPASIHGGVYIISFSFSQVDTDINQDDAWRRGKPRLAGLLCPESNLLNLISPALWGSSFFLFLWLFTESQPSVGLEGSQGASPKEKTRMEKFWRQGSPLCFQVSRCRGGWRLSPGSLRMAHSQPAPGSSIGWCNVPPRESPKWKEERECREQEGTVRRACLLHPAAGLLGGPGLLFPPPPRAHTWLASWGQQEQVHSTSTEDKH